MASPTRGAVRRLNEGNCCGPVNLQITSLSKSGDGKYAHTCTDGLESICGVLATQLSPLADAGSLICMKSYVANKIEGVMKLIITELEVLSKSWKVEEQLEVKTAVDDPMSGVEESSPPESSGNGDRPALSPIQALNPYSTQWSIRAKVQHKWPKNSFVPRGQSSPVSVFNVELIDDQGTQVEGSFWREMADKYYDNLEEGKVYYFSKFTVKPANKNYATVNNDYSLNFGPRSEVVLCEDQDTTNMKEQLQATRISELPKYLNRKVPVTVMGVVTSVGAIGTVKRKADSSEVVRRDITIVDQSLRSVDVTCWGKLADDNVRAIEALMGQAPVAVVSSCRVTTFSGLALTTLSRSSVSINPDSKEARELKDWYQREGSGQPVVPIGEGLEGVKAGAGSGGSSERRLLRDFHPSSDNLPSPDAKPEYCTTSATVVHINPDQNLYYLANPENNRKVVEQGGRYYCEFDQKYCDRAVQRYVMLMKVSDQSGECFLNAFNDQAEQIIGVPAEEMAKLRTSEPSRFNALLKRAQWQELVVRVCSRARELPQGDVRMRHTVQNLVPLDFAAECRLMLQGIHKRMAAKA
ncbi:unnamed protein product [Ostreobium quekettii]|uniref:Replication protein A subunit n=1 Tax=Ostreobium quekettii TaxID=121088 RepID=A0A8S1J957_9CHLO|nr:unnamed protein product [Ostreobium quekettii]